ncbi:MAG TPA: glutamate formimidoyltransferase [Gemmatimonadaceae bacterium]|nr:glutamate formimidoyltransferase [Gemmatimonadaceae bacterium]
MTLVECVPNFSEGRRPEIIQSIRDAIAAVSGVVVLDVSSDDSHNRTVITFVAPVERAVDAAFAGIAKARDTIDLTMHSGAHPRMGAADVVPFIPLEGTTMEQCVSLARALGERVGKELGVPVFLYERAATSPVRENLADIRRGEFEKIREELGTSPVRTPDFGPPRSHPTAGTVAIGARPFLVAYNVYLGDASNIGVAKEVAKAVRGSSGGLRNVKAMGLEVDGQAQVSMNLVDIEKTPMFRAYDMVKMEATAHGVSPTWSELVGLVPERAIIESAARYLQLRNFSTEQLLEHKVRAAASDGISLSGFRAAIASSNPAPGGGSASAHAGSIAAALVQMVAGLTIGRKKYADVEATFREIAQQASSLGERLAQLVDLDAQSYEAVSAAYKLPKATPEQESMRKAAITASLIGASEVPLETARACATVAELAEIAAAKGNVNARADAGVAALMAEAACRGAAFNVKVNVDSLDDSAAAHGLTEAAENFVRAASAAAARTAALVQGD